ncbi:MAG: lipopolysaccharide heptosyltransferase II [bacterium]
MREGAPERILIIRLSSIGDIVLTTPLIRILRNKFPQSRIDFLTKSRYASLICHHPAVSNIIEFPDDGKLDALIDVRKKIRAGKYDVILDLHKNFRSIFLSALQGAEVKSRLKKYGVRRFILVKTGINFYSRINPVYERYLDVARRLNIENDCLGTELYFPADVASSIRSKLSDFFPVQANIIAIAPGGGFATKKWPIEYYTQLAGRLIAAGYKCCLLGNEADKNLAAKVTDMHPLCVDFTGKLNLLESAAIVAQAKKLITNDSGMMHIAEAVGTPVVAIFGSTVRELGFFPIRSDSRVVENTAIRCRPCSHVGRNSCPRGHFRCMRTIEPERVLSEIIT